MCIVDLHIHLDGALSLNNIRELANLQGIRIPSCDKKIEEKIMVSSNCRDLNEFLKKFAFPCSLLQTKEGITRAIRNLQEELKAQGLIYAEIRFAPQKSMERGLSQEEVVLAALEGLSQSDFMANLIVCCMRDQNNEVENMETIRLAKKYQKKGICAFDLAGAEGLYPTRNFKKLFDYGKKLGVPYTIHAGEAAGPESVEKAVSFGARRIGHGVRAAEDEQLLKILAEKKITLELCPTSNLNTGVFSDISDFPIRKLMEAGVCVTINTDDPAISGTSLRKEWELIVKTFLLNEQEQKELIKNAIRASFANESQRARLELGTEKGFII